MSAVGPQTSHKYVQQHMQHITHHLASISTIGFIQFTTSSSLFNFTTFDVGAFCNTNYNIIMSFVTYRISSNLFLSVTPCLFMKKI